MFQFIKSALSSGSEESSRRVMMFNAMLMMDMTAASIVVVAILACAKVMATPDVVPVMSKLIYAMIALNVVILLLAGIITWQNINETINSVKGVPNQFQSFQQTIKSVETTAVDHCEEVHNPIPNQP